MTDKDNENTAALALLNTSTADTTAPATAGAMAPTAAVQTVPGVTTPGTRETAAAATPATSQSDLLYKPMFSVRTEKLIYVLCVLLSLGAIVVSVIAADSNWPKIVGDMCGVCGGLVGSLASAFGVSYTTMKMI